MDTEEYGSARDQNIWEKYVGLAVDALTDSYSTNTKEEFSGHILRAYVNFENTCKHVGSTYQPQLMGLMSWCLAATGKIKEARQLADSALKTEPEDPGASLAQLEITLTASGNPDIAGKILAGVGNGYWNYGSSSRDMADNFAGFTLGLIFGGVSAIRNIKRTDNLKRTAHAWAFRTATGLYNKLRDYYYLDFRLYAIVYTELLSAIERTEPLKIGYADVFQTLYGIPPLFEPLGLGAREIGELIDFTRQVEVKL